MTEKEKIAFNILGIAHTLKVDNVSMSGENAKTLYNLIKSRKQKLKD